MSTTPITPDPKAQDNAQALDFLLTILQTAAVVAQGFLDPAETAIDRAVGGILAIIQKANQAHIALTGAPLDPALIKVEEPLPDEPAPAPAVVPANVVAGKFGNDVSGAPGSDNSTLPPPVLPAETPAPANSPALDTATHTITESGARVTKSAVVPDTTEK